MTFNMTFSTTTTGTLWNGPVCGTCGAKYLNRHKCSREDLLRKIAELQSLLGCPSCGQQIGGAHFCPGPDLTKNCPCRPENGGSGICGCTLSGPKITC